MLHPGGAFVLKACIFTTGLAGIVAEYVMATLASYLLGDAVRQWALTISLMLFSMGLGSRLSRNIRGALLDAFVGVELALSLLCAASALVTYSFAPYVENLAPLIYLIAVAIGLLIGLEIPLVTRLNDWFEELRLNISSVMEKDYYGALLGGLLFAFVALPRLGLTYTPILLGSVNFVVAFLLFVRFREALKFKKWLTVGFSVVSVLLFLLFILAEPITLFGEQQKYRDRVVFQKQTPYQKIVMTQWKQYFWLYLDGNEQFSSFDEERYHEPLVHPAMRLAAARERVLILGGGDGLALREVLKYDDVDSAVLVDIDAAVTQLGRENPMLLELNNDAFGDPRVEVVNGDGFVYLKESDQLFDVIIVDLPDPKTVSLARLYSRDFYRVAIHHLARAGTLVTQATSPFFSAKAFLCILKTLRAAGIPAVAYHNHIPTMGEWGWVLGQNRSDVKGSDLKSRLLELCYDDQIDTRFLNREAMASMLNFGKDAWKGFDQVEVNELLNLSLYRYYQEGFWGVY
ncbi:MAG: polyamine aminopropyltransferase [Acidobacteriota bacterium]